MGIQRQFKIWWWRILLAAYLIAYLVLAFRRWGCWPWTDVCVAEFERVGETAILFLWIEDRDAVFASLLTIAAAIFGIWFAWNQEQEARRRRFEAALGRLAHTCSGLSAYLREAAEAIIPVFDARQGERIPSGTAVGNLPSFPASTVSDLGEIIDTADRSTANYARRFLTELQVQSARLHDLPNELSRDTRVVVAANIETLIVDMVELDALLASLFALAREEQRKIEHGPTLADVMNSMNVLGFRDDRFARARASLTRRYSS